MLTVNAVIHRANIDRIAAMVEQAVALGASRVEIAHVQYYGWALANRAKLMPTRQQVERAVGCVEVFQPSRRLRRQGLPEKCRRQEVLIVFAIIGSPPGINAFRKGNLVS
jgi:hypothetical protein